MDSFGLALEDLEKMFDSLGDTLDDREKIFFALAIREFSFVD